MNEVEKNVLVFSGPSSSGKSKALIAGVKQLGYPVEHMRELPKVTALQLLGFEEPILTCQHLDLPLLISDEECIKAATILDDLKHYGLHHTHPDEPIWGLGVVRNQDRFFHRHETITKENELPTFPFTVKDSNIPYLTAEFFWWAVLNAPTDGVVVAELARGRNGFPPESEFSNVDFSCETMAHRFVDENIAPEQRLPLAALDRIRGLIWVQATFETRLFRAKTYRQFRDETVTRFFAEDDFYHFQQLLESHDIPVLHINNEVNQTHPYGIIESLERELLRRGYPEVAYPLLQELQEPRIEVREIRLFTLSPQAKETVW